jgi:SPP1 family predicted phage head-tail adaptor
VTVRAGELTTRLRIEEPVKNEFDAAGHPIEKWRLFAKVWGEQQELSANETERTQQNQAAASLTYKIRYKKGVNAGMRLCFEEDKVNRVVGIEGVIKDRKRTEMLLTCREVRDGQ